MQIFTSPDSPEKALISPQSREEQDIILDGLTVIDYLRSQSRLLVQKIVGRPPELSLSREALNTLVGSMHYDEDPNKAGAVEVYEGVTHYLASSQPVANSPTSPINPHTA